jgi:hypothetical protein
MTDELAVVYTRNDENKKNIKKEKKNRREVER